MEIKEHDVIKYKGLIGTVVHIYPNEEAYVVEFTDSNGSDVETILKSQIENEIYNKGNSK